MSLWGKFLDVLNPAKDLIEVFKENEENKGQRTHTERIADAEINKEVLQQFAKEFHARNQRTWWDSLVDGLNRLPRPLLTFAIISMFVLAIVSPDYFLTISNGLSNIPDGYWTLLGVIVAFYFGGRMQIKAQDMAMKGSALKTAKQILEQRQTASNFATEREHPLEHVYRNTVIEDDVYHQKNKVVEKWLDSHASVEEVDYDSEEYN